MAVISSLESSRARTTREKPSCSAVFTPAGGVDRHLGGGVERHGGGQCFYGGGNAPILHDQGVDAGFTGGFDAAFQSGELPVEGDDVKCLMHPDAEAVGVGHGVF